jgi:metal-dependent amidase/aminoacylase/carboxypeptidase family protein
MTGEDFSFYQEQAPGLFLLLGTGEEAHQAPLHNGRFDFDESVLLTGVELYRRILGLCER